MISIQDSQDKGQAFLGELSVTEPNGQNIQNVYIQNNYYKNVED